MNFNLKLFCFILGVLFGITQLKAENIPLDLNGKWDFKTDIYNQGITKGWCEQDFNTTNWDNLTVPGSWNTEIAYSDYTGIAWYRKQFNLKNIDSSMDYILCFDAVYSDAEVWMNGRKLGTHDLGVTAFSFNVNEAINKNGSNTIAVRVDNTYKLGATWNWGGISRSVRLEVVPKNRIEDIRVTPDVDLKNKKANINIKASVRGDSRGTLKININDSSGKVVSSKNITLPKNDSDFETSLLIKRPQLWHFDSPHLYTVSFTYSIKDEKDFSRVERFGVRKVEVDGYRLLLNGESVRLNGANYVPDNRFYGGYLPKNEMKKVVDDMKRLGVNMARLSHIGLSKEMLDYIDEKGILVFEEIPLWNRNVLIETNNPTALRWLTELITERYNHPCIVGWSVGNEIGWKYDNLDLKGYLESSLKHVKELDPSRFSVYVTNSAIVYPDEPVLLSDIIMFNRYDQHGEKIDLMNQMYPGKPIFLSESNSSSKAIGEKLDDDVNFRAVFDDMRGREYMIGASVWTYNDYRTNYRDYMTQASGSRPWGMVDAYGRHKRAYKSLQVENSPLKTFDLLVEKTREGIKGTLNIQPRELLDLPAYEMNNYKIRIDYYKQNRVLVDSKEIALPKMLVGGSKLDFTLEFNETDITLVEATLISPLAYEIHAIRKHLDRPVAPSISLTQTATYSVRVFFEKHSSAEEYYVVYAGKKTKPTIEDYIEIGGLKLGGKYDFKLVAVNDFGETEIVDPISLETRIADLPPVILFSEQTAEYIHLGYSTTANDFIYEVEYGLSPNKLSHKIIHTVGGACKVPIIKENATHYLRIRGKHKYGFASEWTPVYSVPKSE